MRAALCRKLMPLASDFFQFIQRIHVCHDAIRNQYFQVCTTPPCTQVRCLCRKLLSTTVLFQILLHVVYGAFLYRFALQIFLGRLALYDFASVRLAPFNRFWYSYTICLVKSSAMTDTSYAVSSSFSSSMLPLLNAY